jgi:hypothetical protein
MLRGSGNIFRLLIKNREDGSSVDRILLTSNARYIPADLGNGLLAPRCG